MKITVPSQAKAEMIADVLEAVENLRRWKPLYLAVLRQTGSREAARKAVKWVSRVEKEAA